MLIDEYNTLPNRYHIEITIGDIDLIVNQKVSIVKKVNQL